MSQSEALHRIIARIDAWASIHGAGGASDALLEVGQIARLALNTTAQPAGCTVSCSKCGRTAFEEDQWL